MDNVIGALQSKTMWGVLVTLFCQGLTLAGKDVSGIDPTATSGQIVTAIGAIAAVYAGWGRVAAKTQIVQVLPLKPSLQP